MNPTIFYLLGGGLVIYSFLRNSNTSTPSLLAKKISWKVDDVLVRSLVGTALELDITVRVQNDNIVGGQVKSMSGFVSFNGVDVGTFSKDQPTEIPAKEETVFDFDVFVDISNRGLPASFRTIWRSGTFTGNLIVTGVMDTTLGQIDFQQSVKVI